MTAAITFGGGALLGFASSLHCVGMCGGIALLLALPQGRGGAASALAAQLPLHAGRALSYMVLGGLVGGLGAATIGAVSLTGAHLLMRWAAAMSLAWVGFSTMGLMPSPALIGHAILPRLAMPRGMMTASAVTGKLAAGMGWGLMPCGMVYGALLFAAFAGSVWGGVAVMSGFALGTVPALMLVQGGSSALSRLARRPQLRTITGAALVLLSIASVLSDEATLMRLCRTMGLFV